MQNFSSRALCHRLFSTHFCVALLFDSSLPVWRFPALTTKRSSSVHLRRRHGLYWFCFNVIAVLYCAHTHMHIHHQGCEPRTPGRQVALFTNIVCRLGELGEVEGGGGEVGSNRYYAFRRMVALRIFCRVPELVGTFRWHCYPARFLRPAAFVSLSPIVPASFVPWLQQWLFFCLFIYMCTFCPCVFCLFCSAVCCVFLSSCCKAGK